MLLPLKLIHKLVTKDECYLSHVYLSPVGPQGLIDSNWTNFYYIWHFTFCRKSDRTKVNIPSGKNKGYKGKTAISTCMKVSRKLLHIMRLFQAKGLEKIKTYLRLIFSLNYLSFYRKLRKNLVEPEKTQRII